jgi:hypothetical protein
LPVVSWTLESDNHALCLPWIEHSHRSCPAACICILHIGNLGARLPGPVPRCSIFSKYAVWLLNMADLCDFCCKVVLHDYSVDLWHSQSFHRASQELPNLADPPKCPFCAALLETLTLERRTISLDGGIYFRVESCSEGYVWLVICVRPDRLLGCPWLITCAEVKFETTTTGRARVDCE